MEADAIAELQYFIKSVKIYLHSCLNNWPGERHSAQNKSTPDINVVTQILLLKVFLDTFWPDLSFHGIHISVLSQFQGKKETNKTDLFAFHRPHL